MTFTVYDPANNSLPQVVNAILAPNSGVVVVPGSIKLKYRSGSGFGSTAETPPSSVSFYDSSIAALGIGPGLLLTSGDGSPALSNLSDGYSVELTPSETDASLTQAVQTAFKFAGEVQDASTLEFQFTVNNPALTGIRFDLVFGSDEFPEYVDSSFVDIAGVFVNGVNYALFNGNSKQPLSVTGTNLEQATNTAFVGLGGNDLIVGGAGKDTSAYSAVLSSYSVTKTATGYTVTDKTGTDGSDTLTSIEALRFTDKSINLQIQAQAALAPAADVTVLAEAKDAGTSAVIEKV